ncbi:MAG: hypothetical protein ACR2O4_05200 [Hyphomicrobiaceae bacterium]
MSAPRIGIEHSDDFQKLALREIAERIKGRSVPADLSIDTASETARADEGPASKQSGPQSFENIPEHLF